MRRDWRDVPRFARKQPGRIIPAVRIKWRGYHNRAGPDKFYDRLNRQTASGDFGAMAEVHLWHDSDGGKYQEIKTDFNGALVQAALKEAKSNH